MRSSFCAFNISRQAFISLNVSVAHTPLGRLRGMLGKLRIRSDEALWVVPSRGIHTIGLLFPIDAMYLDANLRVMSTVESLGPLRIGPLRWRCASVLQLPARSIFESGTQVGDQLLICSAEDMQRYLADQPEWAPEERAAKEAESPPRHG